MKKRRFFLVFSLVILLSSLAYGGSPLGKSIWARPIGLGNAYVGLGADPSTIFINPAGVTGLKTRSFISIYSRPSDDVSLTSLGGSWPSFFGGAFGLGYRNRLISGIPISSTESVDTFDHDLLLGFGRKIKDNLEVGFDFRYLIKGTSPALASTKNGAGTAFDLGALYQHSPYLSLGAAIQDLGLKINYTNGTADNFSPNVAAGASLLLLGQTGYYKSDDQVLTGNLELGKENNNPLLAHLGVEWWPVRFFAFRLGLDQSPKNTTETFSNTTFGIGVKAANLTFDYAYYRNESSFLNNSHYFSFGYLEPLPAARAKPPELKHFSDVPQDYWAREAIEALTTLGIINWYPDGTFRPEQPISRAEIVTLMVRAKDYPLPTDTKQVFSDVPQTFAAATEIQAAFENRLALGYPDRTFKPRQNTSRTEGVVFTSRFTDLKLAAGRPPYADLASGFWALREVLAAKEAGLLTLLAKGDRFSPSWTLTRAELADLLYRTSFAREKVRSLTPP